SLPASMFPQELVDIVIDFAHRDRRVLSACALTCRRWVPSSRLHLFRIISLDEQNRESW
ncbi:hypothetical protein C8J56DRAFT_717992, partial [Mycena floridula]